MKIDLVKVVIFVAVFGGIATYNVMNSTNPIWHTLLTTAVFFALGWLIGDIVIYLFGRRKNNE